MSEFCETLVTTLPVLFSESRNSRLHPGRGEGQEEGGVDVEGGYI